MGATGLLVTSSILLLLSAILSLFIGNRKASPVFSGLLFVAGIVTICGGITSWGRVQEFAAPAPIYLGLAPMAFKVDSLSAVFTVLLGVVMSASALFTPGYLEHLNGRIKESLYWSCTNLFVLGMLLTLLSSNAVTFLVFWEVMSLSSAVLVAADSNNKKAQKAALIYLGSTRIATALITGGFLWFFLLTDSWSFADWHVTSAVVPAMLLAIGLSIKAGMWPFHIWLPYAHPTAPSPVSALMSGVMIKVAIYAIIRLYVMDGAGSLVFASLFLAAGTISAFWGILWSLVQHDLKRLLAYSSVENVGLILMAIGICLLAEYMHWPQLTAIGLVAALFHVLNHGVFKSLLFLGAGSVDAAVHTRELHDLGGLAQRMPWTATCFLVGAAAVCSLPPLNGFASKWLIYQGLFDVALQPSNKLLCGFVLAAIGVLAVVGALTMASFTKAFSVTFGGRPRSKSAANAHENVTMMVVPQVALLILCVALGVFSPQVIALLSQLVPGGVSAAASVPTLPLLPLAIILALLAGGIYIAIFAPRRRTTRKYLTWECGYGQLSPRMQVTEDGFVQPIARLFGPIIQYATRSQIRGRDRRHFPEKISAEPSTVALLEVRVYGPLIAAVRWCGEHISKLQAGSIHLYLLYVFITLIVLLAIGART
jgi:hydrogenase-4 component B